MKKFSDKNVLHFKNFFTLQYNSYNYWFENYREISHIKLGFFKKFSKITTS